MPSENIPGAKFTANAIFKDKCVHVAFSPAFLDTDWPEFDRYYKSQFEKGFLFWDIDLRNLAFMNSQLLGLFVGLNSELTHCSGQLRLLVAENSMIDQLLTISKLRRIMTIVTVSGTA